ncbi:Alpha-L-fucosidase 2 [Escovopsis weberi]|uniref:Alpha-L-fucosidase 2 n=1 Tax=Escovopsis weberi TaxID=150374 RepID=A0A0N0RTQ5_ESCWE|nr:Alpha-L-fucosidase 2 [Escovopsis weberi]
MGRSFISRGLILAFVSRSLGLANLDGSRHLWYDEPAADWETGALPIGCGRLGASIFGGVANEVITITEDTIWSGPLQDRTPENGLSALPRVRELLLSGNITAAGQMVLGEMTPEESSERSFSYFGNLNVAFGHGDALDYQRWLDTRQGDSGVSYTFDGVDYTREYIASYPASVLAARFSASKDGALAFNASFDRLEHILTNSASVEDGIGSIVMSGSSGQSLADDPILFTGEARFVAPGVQVSGASLQISGATVVDVFFDTETNYRYPDQAVLESKIDSKLSSAIRQGFTQVREEALADSGSLLGRASIDLGTSPDGLANLPTNQRVINARSNTRDIQLTTLTWNLGRHLLVAASRKTDGEMSMPANLQGIWNNKTSAAWGGKFTININTEMNYWPAAITNLVETHPPLFDLMSAAQPRGQEMARKLYGCDGTVFHHNLDLWGDPAPTDNYTSSTMWPMGAAWLVQYMIDHYRFTGDRAFLADTAYPFLVDVARFYYCNTFEWEGHRVTGPSLSPENTFVTPDYMSVAGSVEPMDMSVEMDNQLMRDVVTSLLEAAAELGLAETDEDVAAARRFLPLIREPQVGSLGQILEWRYEYQEKAKGHKHLSPLYGNHPSKQFSPLVNATLGRAAKVLLDRRVSGGSGSTGWSRIWLINQYARQFSGADAWGHVVRWFEQYPTTNLWNTDSGSGFQIDGNYGFTSAVTEMLLQSHAGVVHLLPALPAAAVPAGRASGLLARGGFEVDVEWRDGGLKTATVRSTLGKSLAIRVQDGQTFSVNGKAYEEPIQTTKGAKYVITLH